MKRVYSFALALLCGTGTLFINTSCGGSGGGSGSGVVGNKAIGLAPAAVTGDITLTPTDANVQGIITLHKNPAGVAYFNNRTGTEGAFTGNYTYTKVGPNMAELTLDNLRTTPINSATDVHWTIIAHITFVSENRVILTGTETSSGGGYAQGPMGTANFQYDYQFEMAGN